MKTATVLLTGIFAAALSMNIGATPSLAAKKNPCRPYMKLYEHHTEAGDRQKAKKALAKYQDCQEEFIASHRAAPKPEEHHCFMCEDPDDVEHAPRVIFNIGVINAGDDDHSSKKKKGH